MPGGGPACNFYVLTGSEFECTPFHGMPEIIVSKEWANGGTSPFIEAKIRLNGGDGIFALNTKIWTDEFKVASVVMNGNAVPQTCSKGIDRIGRDRTYHEFAGYLTELLVWNRGLSDAEVRTVEEYLLQKYKILVKRNDVYVAIVKQRICSYY